MAADSIFNTNPNGYTVMQGMQDMDSYFANQEAHRAKMAQEAAQTQLARQHAQYYPAQAEADLRRAATDEQRAQQEFELKKQQLQMGQQRHDPFTEIASLENVLKTYPKNSPQYHYANQRLGAVVSGIGAQGQRGHHQSVPGLGAAPSSNGGGELSMGQPGGQALVNPYSRSRERGTETITMTPDGKYVTNVSSTTANLTNMELRMEAEQELNTLSPHVEEGFSPYAGSLAGPQAAITSDYVAAQWWGDKDAMERLKKLALAMKLVPETAAIVGRMTKGGDVSEGTLEELMFTQSNGLINNKKFIQKMIPQEAQQWAHKEYNNLQKKAMHAAASYQRTGFPLEMEQAPYYLGAAQQGPTTWTDISAAQGASQPSANNSKVVYVGKGGRGYTIDEIRARAAQAGKK